MGEFIVNIFRSILFFFDQIIYGFIPTVYAFIKILASQRLFDDTVLQNIANNIYAVLGVFMLFRLAFVLLNAIVDPDKLTNKEKGFGKIMTRVIFALVLIVALPYAFNLAFTIQQQVLEKSIVEKIILGTTPGGGDNYGQQMARISLSSFYTCEEKAVGYEECKGTLNEEFNQAFPSDDPTNNVDFSVLADQLNEKTDPTTGDKKVYIYKYSAGISTLAGIVILGMLVVFAFDIAVRVVKLGFLQLIIPVAVIGYIEPGGGIFNRWRDMCVKTYINLFIRILALAFIVLVISILNSTAIFQDLSGNDLSPGMDLFVRVFIIIGVLMFAKDAPKMISEIFKLNEGSIGSLNPFKKLSGMAGAGIIGGVAAGGMKLAGGAFGGLSGGLAAGKRGGSIIAGLGQGAKAGFGNIKMKDAVKGGVTGLGKTFVGGTFGAANKGGSYAAGKVTGKEEKVGVINAMKQGMADKAATMHQNALNENELTHLKKLDERKAKTGSFYQNANYQKAIDSIEKAKDKLTEMEKQRQFFANRYQLDPGGSFIGTDGNSYTNRGVYENANQNFVNAQKNVDFYKSELERIDKLPEFEDDAADRKMIEKRKAQEKASKPSTFKDVPTPESKP